MFAWGMKFRISWRTLGGAATVSAVALAIAAAPVFGDDTVDRYALKPIFEEGGISPSEGPSGTGEAGLSKKRKKKSAPILSGRLFRHVEGIDASPRTLSRPDTLRELGDPFGKAIAASGGALPSNVGQVLALLDAGIGPGKLSNQTVFIVSETGQIPVQEAPQLTRSERAIVARSDASGRQIVFVLPAMRADGILEIMGWDARKNLFNYYERKFSGVDDGVRWIWKGDSSHAWDPRTRNGFCFGCHRNGEPVMKEFKAPWQNWHSQNATIKDEAITEDSPLRKDPLFSVLAENRYLRKAENLENIVREWISRTNETQIAAFKAGKLSYRRLIAPLFRTTTINLQASQDVSEGSQGPVRIPWSFFYNARALLDGAQLECDGARAFGQSIPEVPRQVYLEALAQLDFALHQSKDEVQYSKKPGDTHFAFLVPEPSQADVDLVFRLVDEDLVSRRLAATALLVDVPNPVYSQLREALLAAAPDKKIAKGVPAAKLEAEFVAALRKLKASSATPAATQAGLREFFDLWDGRSGDWEAKGCGKLSTYLANVGRRWQAGDIAPYFKLLGSRREAFRASDHKKLEESQLLFPKSATTPGLVMHFDGSVGPR